VAVVGATVEVADTTGAAEAAAASATAAAARVAVVVAPVTAEVTAVTVTVVDCCRLAALQQSSCHQTESCAVVCATETHDQTSSDTSPTAGGVRV
jgi:hypothetical protein